MHDLDIRLELRREFKRLHENDIDTHTVEELGLCQGLCRVDMAVVNGQLHGYEIKSERDTLSRLPGQIDVYSKALEKVTIVASKNHIQGVERLVPKWWGIWVALKAGPVPAFECTRKADSNPDLNPFALAQFLWRDEVLRILSDYGLDKGLRSKSRDQLWEALTRNFTIAEIGDFVRTRLKSRAGNWRAAVQQG